MVSVQDSYICIIYNYFYRAIISKRLMVSRIQPLGFIIVSLLAISIINCYTIRIQNNNYLNQYQSTAAPKPTTNINQTNTNTTKNSNSTTTNTTTNTNTTSNTTTNNTVPQSNSTTNNTDKNSNNTNSTNSSTSQNGSNSNTSQPGNTTNNTINESLTNSSSNFDNQTNSNQNNVQDNGGTTQDSSSGIAGSQNFPSGSNSQGQNNSGQNWPDNTAQTAASISETIINPTSTDTNLDPNSLVQDYANKAGATVPIVDPNAADQYPRVPTYPVDPVNSFYQV